MFAESFFGSSKLKLTEDSFVHFLTDDESVFEKIHFKHLTNEDFMDAVFNNDKYSYKRKLYEAIEVLERMGIEEYLVNNGKLYVRGLVADDGILMVRYGIYSKC